MQDHESFRLLHGPYQPPAYRRGDRLFCEMRGGAVAVGQTSDGLIQWPCAKIKGRRSLILCGDLIRAVDSESAVAICHHWGVHPATVRKWRRILGVDALNEGSLRLTRHYVRQAIVAAHQPEALAKQVKPRKGRPARKDRAPMPHVNYFKPDEIALLGTDLDRVIGTKLGRRAMVVGAKRRELGILAFWKKVYQKRPRSAKESREARQKRAERLSARQKQAIAEGTCGLLATIRLFAPQEIALLGTNTDAEIARVLGRSPKTIQWKRKSLGIPSFWRSRRVQL